MATPWSATSNDIRTHPFHFYVTDVSAYEVLPSVNLKLKLPGTL